jgi:PAS domain S-box-containing protein
VPCEYNGSHPDVHVTFDRHLSDNEKKTRMKASESLQNDQSTATEKALRFAFDATPAFIHTAHSARPDGDFDYFNRCWLDFLGKSLEDVCGWRWTESVHTEDIGGIVQKWRAALASGESMEAEARVRCGDGTYRAFLSKQPVASVAT